ncbi:MAG: DUF1176 domain-containing protein [Oscillatoriales cyanobacterium SM2_2_1]|nr:DUF1176 domain-containing protein [Oscillatoriales cyanobacterium SM2_2_1]
MQRNYRKFGVCQSDGGFEPDLGSNQHQVYDLGQNRYLVLMVCRLAAYQAVTEWVVYESTSQEPKVLPVAYEDFDQGKVIPATNRVMTGYPSFDPKTQGVTNFQKFRGPGDCGILRAIALTVKHWCCKSFASGIATQRSHSQSQRNFPSYFLARSRRKNRRFWMGQSYPP